MGFLWSEPAASPPFSIAKFLCFIASFINKAFANSPPSTNTVLIIIFPTQIQSNSSVLAWKSTALALGFKVSASGCPLPFLASVNSSCCILTHLIFLLWILLHWFEFLSHLLCLLLKCGKKDGSPIWVFPVPGHLPLVMELPLAVTEQGSYFPPSSLLQSQFWLLIPPSSASIVDLSFLWANNNNTYLPLRGVVKIN